MPRLLLSPNRVRCRPGWRWVLGAVAVAMVGTPAGADVVVKDTLDPANFVGISAGGGYIAGDPSEIDAVDGRTFLGILPQRSGRIGELTLRFFARSQGSGQPVNDPTRTGLFDLSVGYYRSLAEASSSPSQVDAFLPQTTQPDDLFANPVGQTAAMGGLGSASVFEATYDLRDFNLLVSPGQPNYLGISATGVPAGLDFQPQRTNDSGVVLGGQPDYLRGSVLPPGLSPMSTFYPDAIQNSVRITITNFGDARDGDFNGDGVVDAADYTVWRDNYGATSGPGLIADGNVDGVVDQGDYDTWRQWYGATVPTAPGDALSVPEPGALVLVVGAVLGGWRGRSVARRVGP